MAPSSSSKLTGIAVQ
ncbi:MULTISPECIES: colicin release lysis protein [Enterobacteriaceae]|nr:hypothetical protein [Salmonella enterica]MCA7537890.1 hypothetical protein [Escherichia coli]